MLVVAICLRQAGQFLHDEKIYARNLITTYQTFGTMTTHATETKSIGLPADMQACPELAKGHGFLQRL